MIPRWGGNKKKGRRAFHPIFRGGSDRRLARCPRGRPGGEGKKLAPDVYQRDGGGTVKQKPGL